MMLTTPCGRTTITVRNFMTFGHIVDEDVLIEYSTFIRKDTAAAGFRQLFNMTWDRNSSYAIKRITFDITVASVRMQEMIFNNQLVHSSTAISSVTPPIISGTDPPTVVTPALKRSRVSQKITYSPPTLAKYSEAIQNKVISMLAIDIPSNDSLRDQVFRKVISRLENRFNDTEDKCNTNEVVIANIKELIASMNKFGRNDRESIQFKKNLALAVTSNLSLVKLMVATGLSRRVLQQGKKMRELCDVETGIKGYTGGARGN